jgi:acyl-CoA thioester hydrolase
VAPRRQTAAIASPLVFVHRERVRFRDLDPMGHVNNAVFLTYVESARVAFLEHLGAAKTLDEMAIIVARAEIDFRAPVRFGDEVEVTVRATRFGDKSFDLEHDLRVGETVVAEVKTVLVTYDYEQRRPVEIPSDWREKLAA